MEDLPPAMFTMSDHHEDGFSVSNRSDVASESGSFPGEMVGCHVDKYTSPCCIINCDNPSEAKYDTEQYERALHESWLALCPKFSMPWDVLNSNSINGFGTLFSRPRPSPYPAVTLHRKDSVLEDQLRGQALARATLRIRSIKPKADTAVRSVAISKWLRIINHSVSSFRFGRFILSQAALITSDEAIQQAVADVVSMRATRTLSKRAADMMRYVLWATSTGVNCFPPTEESLYAYLSYLRQCGAAAGAFTSIKSSIAFAGAVFGLDNALLAVSAPMIKGIVDAEAIRKPKRKPKPPLTADSIRMLETIQLQSPVFADRVFAGFCIFATFGRLRFSDAQRVISLVIDQADDGSGYLEGVQDGTKTGTTVRKKNEYLPVAAPLCGLTSSQWAHIFLADLSRAGLIDEEGKTVHLALLTCPSDTALFTDKPLDSEQSKVWLQDILISAGLSVSFCRSLGTHSMKCTTLSWCAKFGLSARTRKFLGYHVDKTDTSLAIYSRDLASQPLRQLTKVIQAVSSRSFFPDSTRSGYFSHRRVSEVQHEPSELVWLDTGHSDRGDEDDVLSSMHSDMPPIPPVRDVLDDWILDPTPCFGEVSVQADEMLDGVEPPCDQEEHDDSDESSSNSSFSHSSSSSDVPENDMLAERFETVVAKSKPRNPARSSSETVYQHTKLGTLHLAHSTEQSRLACGRAMSLAFKAIHEVSFDWPKCKVCFGSDEA